MNATVRQFRYGADNLAYLIYADGAALAIDGGAVAAMLDFARSSGLEIAYVTNTHSHPDHTAGTRELTQRCGAEYLPVASLYDTPVIAKGGLHVAVIHTPGHTRDSFVFHTGPALVTGDTLFNGTVGNCFSGDLQAFYRSIKRLTAFPPETRIYAGHDYVRESLAFARRLEPENSAIDAYLDGYDPAHVVSTLAQELQVNPYLRFNAPPVVALLRRMGLAAETESERWHSLMSIE